MAKNANTVLRRSVKCYLCSRCNNLRLCFLFLKYSRAWRMPGHVEEGFPSTGTEVVPGACRVIAARRAAWLCPAAKGLRAVPLPAQPLGCLCPQSPAEQGEGFNKCQHLWNHHFTLCFRARAESSGMPLGMVRNRRNRAQNIFGL